LSGRASNRPPLSPKEAWLSDGRQVLHFRPSRWDRWSQQLEVTVGELLPDQPVPLLKRLSRVNPLGRFATTKLAGEGPGCRRRQPGGGDTKSEPPRCQKSDQHWLFVIDTRRQPGWPVPSGNLCPNLWRSARAGGPHSPPAARRSPPGAALIGAKLSPRVNHLRLSPAPSAASRHGGRHRRGDGCRR